jgi:hypothetical protein
MAKHSRSSHAQARVAPVVLTAVLVVVALGLAAAVLLLDTAWALRVTALVALLTAVVAAVTTLTTSRAFAELRRSALRDAETQRRQMSALRQDMAQLQEVTSAVAAELARLRAELTDYVLPLSAEPDPVYPSLHLPLVRAAFAEEPPDARVLVYTPPVTPSEVPPTVRTDGHAEGLPARRLVDLTQPQESRRHAAGA